MDRSSSAAVRLGDHSFRTEIESTFHFPVRTRRHPVGVAVVFQ